MKILIIVGIIISQIILGSIISSYSPPKIMVDYTVISKNERTSMAMVGKVPTHRTHYYLVVNDGHNTNEEVEVDYDEYHNTNERDAKQFPCNEYRDFDTLYSLYIIVMAVVDIFLIINYFVSKQYPFTC